MTLRGYPTMVFGALSLFAVTTPVLAQEARPASPGDFVLGEVVVTAQRREENLQTVPVAVSAFSGDALQRAGVSTATDLNLLAPGLNIQIRGNSTQPTIRGVGTTAQIVGNEPNVAVYVDGAYQPISQGNFFRFSDVERVEVLRGPQGTLFGRNATGGLLNFITRKPATDGMHGSGKIGYSRFDTLDLDGYLTGPLGESVAASVSGYYSRGDGYLSDPNRPGANPGRNRAAGVRGKLMFTPNDRFTATLTGDYAYVNDAVSVQPTPVENSSPFITPNGPPPLITVSDLPYKTALSAGLGKSKFRQYGATLDMSLDFDGFELVSITSYRNAKYNALNDGDFSPYNATRLEFDNFTDTISQDLRLQSSGNGRFQWIVGGFAFDNKESYENFDFDFGVPPAFTAPIYPLPFLLLDVAQIKTKAYAVYGQASYDITDQFTAIVGARYSTEKKSVLAAGSAARGLGTPLILLPTQRDSTTFNDFSPRITLQYKFTPDTMIYGSFSKGFKSGTYNPLQIADAGGTQPGNATRVVKPEKIDAYEAGLKTDLTRNLRLNFAAFKYNYKNIQTTINIGGINRLENAAKASIKGAEAELYAAFPGLFDDDDQLTLRANIAYLDAIYDSYPNATLLVPAGPGRGVVPLVNQDVSGNRMVRSPKWTEGVGVNYRNRQEWGVIQASVDAYFNSGFFYDEGNIAIYAQPSFEKVNASLSLSTPDERYTVSVWGKNITDSTTFMHIYQQNNFGIGKAWYPPATYGVSFEARF